jgi:glycosyltransferase involved in cell wall biosynthesis
MKVLILHSRYLSGHASGENAVVHDEARLLADHGHDVQVWTPSPNPTSRVELLGTAARAVWSRDATAEVSEKIRRFGPDVVHIHNLFPMLSPAVLRTSEEWGAATLMTLHNYRLMCLPATFLRDGLICEDCLGRTPWPGVVHRCFRDSLAGSGVLAASLSVHRALGTFDRVSLYLPVGDFVLRKYVEAGFPPERFRVKSNFVHPTSRREGPGDYFLFLGRLSKEKGVHTLLEAWGDITARLLIVGDGPQMQQLRQAAPKNVEFTGMADPSEVPDILRGARAVLLPSTWYEAQPRVILEAYAAAVPVLASRIGGLSDLVEDGSSGLLVAAHDPMAWSRAVTHLNDDSESRRLGHGAYRLWQQRYSPQEGLKGLEAAYREALSRR